ncbi:MAG: fumarylacetoacetate hydrolase family protein [Deltaproteobacteria bacterium]|nr:fumarylacetoacetate hydrolase family protein [Deltaproteobacteria bacterium]
MQLDRALAAGNRPVIAKVAPGSFTWDAPVPRGCQLLDGYAFEQHVINARGKRGLGVPPEWYDVPTYYRSNPRALFGHEATIPYPADETMCDYELEFAAVLGRNVKDATVEESTRAILGYTLFNDCTARAAQRKVMAMGLGPAKGKDFANQLGPLLVTPDEFATLDNVELVARVNGVEWSRGMFGSAEYSFGEIIAFACQGIELYSGDVIGSGTVGFGCGLELDKFLQDGDVVELEASKVGVLRSKVGRAPAPPPFVHTRKGS